MMHCKLQIVFDQALFANTNALFKDCRWKERYNTTIPVNYMVNLDKLWSYFGFKRLKTDQVLSVSILCGPVVGLKASTDVRYEQNKCKINRIKANNQYSSQPYIYG